MGRQWLTTIKSANLQVHLVRPNAHSPHCPLVRSPSLAPHSPCRRLHRPVGVQTIHHMIYHINFIHVHDGSRSFVVARIFRCPPNLRQKPPFFSSFFGLAALFAHNHFHLCSV